MNISSENKYEYYGDIMVGKNTHIIVIVTQINNINNWVEYFRSHYIEEYDFWSYDLTDNGELTKFFYANKLARKHPLVGVLDVDTFNSSNCGGKLMSLEKEEKILFFLDQDISIDYSFLDTTFLIKFIDNKS